MFFFVWSCREPLKNKKTGGLKYKTNTTAVKVEPESARLCLQWKRAAFKVKQLKRKTSVVIATAADTFPGVSYH